MSLSGLLETWQEHVGCLQCVDEQKMKAHEHLMQIFTGLHQRLGIRGTQLATSGLQNVHLSSASQAERQAMALEQDYITDYL